LGFLHQSLGDGVIGGAGEVPLFAGQLPQMPPGGLSTPLLEASPEPGRAQTGPREDFAGEALARAVRGQVGLAEVHAENAFGLSGFGVVHRADHRQEELSPAREEPGGELSDRMPEKAELGLSGGERYREASFEGGEGRQALLHLQTEDAAVVAYGAHLLEGAHGFSFPLRSVGVHHLADHVDGKLGGEAKARPYLPVDQGVEGLPAKGPLFEGHLRGIIAGRVYGPDGVQESVRLCLVREEPDHRRQSHAAQPVESLPHEKGGVEGAFLCRLKPTVSCARFLRVAGRAPGGRTTTERGLRRMMGEELVIRIHPDGTVEAEVEGACGPDCTGLLDPFDRALGAVRERRRKPEYYRQGVRPRLREGGR